MLALVRPVMYTETMKKYSRGMYCFSPPVMLVTFLFEFGSLLYIAWRYKMTTITRLSMLILGALGTFQLTEYMICGGLGISGGDWARFGYVTITLLPPLGIHLAAAIAGKSPRLLLAGVYGLMVAYIAYFLATPGAINSHECRPNYAVFDLGHTATLAYTYYYYGLLALGTSLSLYWSRQKPAVASPLRWLCLGYLTFIVPTVAVAWLNPSIAAGIPSIMCGFAVALAIIIVTCIAPLQARRGRSKGHHATSHSSV